MKKILQESAQNQGEQSLEDLLMNQLLNPLEGKLQRIKIIDDPQREFLSEIREGVILNEHGVLQEIREEVINVATLDDGSPLNKYGLSKCPSCNSLLMYTALKRCVCGNIVCETKRCAVYSRKRDLWYCNRFHHLLDICGINLRWFRF